MKKLNSPTSKSQISNPISRVNTIKWLTIGATALFVYMPFHIFISQWLSTYTGGLDAWKLWKDIFTILVTISFIVTVLILKKQTRLFWYLLGLTTLYGLIHMILLVFTNQPLDTGLLSSAYNLRIFAYVIIGYSLALLLPKTDLTKRFAKLLIILSTVVCFIALLQWVLPKDIMTHFGYSLDRGVKPNFFIDDKPDLPRVFSTLRDPNSLGAFLILPIIIISQTLLKSWKTNRRTFLTGLLLLHILVLLLTFSRSTLLATIIAAGVLLALQNRGLVAKHKTKLIAAGVIFIVVSAGIFVSLRDTYLVENVVLHSDETTVLADPNELRIGLAEKAMNGIIDQPLGHGPGTAGLVSTRLPNGLLTENYFLQIAYEVGIFGFMVFIALLYVIIRTLWDRRNDSITIALLASFAGLVVANMLFHTWANEAVAISWFLLAGLALRSKG